MDANTTERDIVKQVIERYAKFVPSHGNIRLDTVFDDQQGRYALMQVGWERGRRIRGNLIHITVQDDQVWVEYDGIEQGINQDLINAGIAQKRIVLDFFTENERASYTRNNSY